MPARNPDDGEVRRMGDVAETYSATLGEWVPLCCTWEEWSGYFEHEIRRILTEKTERWRVMPMTAKDLRELLEDVDDNVLVVMAKDAEGNGYSPLSDVWRGHYRAETTWSGEAGFGPDDELPDGYDEEDRVEGGVEALILYPVN